MENNISRTPSSTSLPTLNASVSTSDASSSAKPSLTRSASNDSYVGPKVEATLHEPVVLPELPANVNEAPAKSNWRTSLEGKINSGLSSIKSFGTSVRVKLTQGYEAGKEMLHEVGMFLANLGKTLMGIARHNAPAEGQAEAPAAATPPTTAPVELAPAIDEKTVN